MRRAFTLMELIVVIAVLAVLSSILFPVLSSAKAAAAKVQCVSNLHQATIASNLYLVDWDDYFMPATQNPGAVHDPARDRTWVQLLLPYLRSFTLFQCPGDNSARPKSSGVFDTDLAPGDTYARLYEASLRSDIGFNYLYLSPVVLADNDEWLAQPKSLSDIMDHTKTVMFSDSVWSRNEQGVPVGGGSYLVVPPCRYERIGDSVIDTFQADRGTVTFFTTNQGWQEEPQSPYVFGGAWPWHSGRMNVAQVDGSVRSMTPSQLSKGCDVKSDWRGYIDEPDSYIWDLR